VRACWIARSTSPSRFPPVRSSNMDLAPARSVAIAKIRREPPREERVHPIPVAVLVEREHRDAGTAQPPKGRRRVVAAEHAVAHLTGEATQATGLEEELTIPSVEPGDPFGRQVVGDVGDVAESLDQQRIRSILRGHHDAGEAQPGRPPLELVADLHERGTVELDDRVTPGATRSRADRTRGRRRSHRPRLVGVAARRRGGAPGRRAPRSTTHRDARRLCRRSPPRLR
jgi:hypothetical protein